jgi:hypothetical protein
MRGLKRGGRIGQNVRSDAATKCRDKIGSRALAPQQSNPRSTTSTLRDTETPAQTAKEASSGDHQAQRLIAIEAAARKA